MDKEKYKEFNTLFYQFLENDGSFFAMKRMTKLAFYHILENII